MKLSELEIYAHDTYAAHGEQEVVMEVPGTCYMDPHLLVPAEMVLSVRVHKDWKIPNTVVVRLVPEDDAAALNV